MWTCFQHSTPSVGMTEEYQSNETQVILFAQRLTEIWILHSHLTLAVCEEAEGEALGHLSEVADASGVRSTGTGQGAEKIIGQVTAALL